jgi:small subunit ribosomal protein S20
MKKVSAAVEAGDRATAEKEFQTASKLLDRAGMKRIIHPNAAARRKSSLAKKVNSIGS